MTVSLAALRRQLRDLQKRWRMQDWAISLKLVEYLGADPSPYASSTSDTNDRSATIEIARRLAPDHAPIPDTPEMLLAHEFAHILLAELDSQFRYAVRNESVDWRAACMGPWNVARERFCNAFAEAVTGGDR